MLNLRLQLADLRTVLVALTFPFVIAAFVMAANPSGRSLSPDWAEFEQSIVIGNVIATRWSYYRIGKTNAPTSREISDARSRLSDIPPGHLLHGESLGVDHALAKVQAEYAAELFKRDAVADGKL
jgi:hypothetical protein